MRAEPPLRFPIVVSGVGPVPALGMIIGEAPGRNEITQGRPFVGASGEILRKAFHMATNGTEILASGIYITNVFKGDVGKGNPNPSDEMVRDHAPLLRQEIGSIEPFGILLLGRIPCNVFGLIEPMRDLVGSCTSGAIPHLYPCYHPAATLYKRELLPIFNETVATFIGDIYGNGNWIPEWDRGLAS